MTSDVPKLTSFRNIIRSSPFWKETTTLIDDHKFEYLNCYALGSPLQSKNALYQFAYLLELADELNAKVRISDPVLTSHDKELAEKHQCEISFEPTDSSKTLYFLPHAPLDLTEDIIGKDHKPVYLLCNDMVAHTDRLTKKKLNEQYQNLSLLVHLIEEKEEKERKESQSHKKHIKESGNDIKESGNDIKESGNDIKESGDDIKKSGDDAFIVVLRKRKNRNKFVPQIIEYDYSEAYFTGCTITRFKHNFDKGAEWSDSFSDLAWHVIQVKDQDCSSNGPALNITEK